MGIFGRKTWEYRPFPEWPFAIPTTELKIHSSEIDSLDMWPRTAPKRQVKYHFELLETALRTAGQGLSVLHCPGFVARLHNDQARAAFQLASLPAPAGYKPLKPVRVFLVARRGAAPVDLERKLAKFMRSLR